MRAIVVVIVGIMLVAALKAEAPLYSAASIVNAADNQSGALSPNTIATIYGQNLAYGTEALTASGFPGGVLPTTFAGTGVHVLMGSLEANLFYVSPTQINFLVPPNLIPATVNLVVVVDSFAGPSIPIQLAAASPALFQLDQQNAIATRADGSVITPSAPASPGNVVVLYAAGLGQTTPPCVYLLIPDQAARLNGMNDFSVILDGVAGGSERHQLRRYCSGLRRLVSNQCNTAFNDRRKSGDPYRAGRFVEPLRAASSGSALVLNWAAWDAINSPSSRSWRSPWHPASGFCSMSPAIIPRIQHPSGSPASKTDSTSCGRPFLRRQSWATLPTILQTTRAIRPSFI